MDIRVVTFKTDQRSHGCITMTWKSIEHKIKENLLLYQNQEGQDLQAYDCIIKKFVH